MDEEKKFKCEIIGIITESTNSTAHRVGDKLLVKIESGKEELSKFMVPSKSYSVKDKSGTELFKYKLRSIRSFSSSRDWSELSKFDINPDMVFELDNYNIN